MRWETNHQSFKDVQEKERSRKILDQNVEQEKMMCRVSLCSMFAIKFQLQPWFKFYSLLFLMAGDMFWPDLWVVLTIHWRWHHGGGNLLSIIITAASYHCDQLTGDQWPSDLASTCYPDPGPSWWHLGDRWHLLTLTLH